MTNVEAAMLKGRKKIHLIGIGGIGMSALAEVLLRKGYTLSGSDIMHSTITENLARKGVRICYTHDAQNLGDSDLVVYSSAIPGDNPERLQAAKRHIPCMRRAEVLADLMRLYWGIAVAGTHGKTTTSAMITEIAGAAGLEPTVLVGGTLLRYNTNAIIGKGSYFITEADEYDRSFLCLQPVIAVITNIEKDHLDCYRDASDIQAAFIRFAAGLPFYGHLVCCRDDPGVRAILPDVSKPKVTYGIEEGADYGAQDIVFNRNGSSFMMMRWGKEAGHMTLPVAGLHNIRNSLAAAAVADLIDIPPEVTIRALEAYQGVERRFQLKAEVDGVAFIDDYAHHPTEIQSVLESAGKAAGRRIVAIFQPHLYSRTRDFYREFAQALSQAHLAIVTEIYPAREKPIKGVTSALIADASQGKVAYIKDEEELITVVLDFLQAGDMVITMGAGSIWQINEKLINRFKQRF